MAKRRPMPFKRRAITAMTDAAARQLGPGARVGRLQWLGEGLSRRSWCANIETAEGPEHTWVVQVPRSEATREDLDRFALEHLLLGELAHLALSFRRPRPVTVVEVDGVPVNVTTWCFGAPLDKLRMELAPQVIAEVAATIHAIPPNGMTFPGEVHESQRAAVASDLPSLRELDAPFVDEVVVWCTEHLPSPDEPAAFLHGDLLGQNVLWSLEGPPAVLDWEYARTGDPAEDLAIATRGARRVFGTEDGRSMLLNAYNARSPRPVTASELRRAELLLVAGEVAAFLQRYPHSADAELGRLRNLYRRPLEPGTR